MRIRDPEFKSAPHGASRCFRRTAFDGLHQFDLLRVEDFEMPLNVVENNGLPVRADHEVIGVGDDKRFLVAEHDANRSERLRVHQVFDLIGDHRVKLAVLVMKASGKPPTRKESLRPGRP